MKGPITVKERGLFLYVDLILLFPEMIAETGLAPFLQIK
jgi:hypothetical protein